MKSFLSIMKKVEKVSVNIALGCLLTASALMVVASIANGINNWR